MVQPQTERPQIPSTNPDNLFGEGVVAQLAALAANEPPEPSDDPELDVPEDEPEEPDTREEPDEPEAPEQPEATNEPAKPPRHTPVEWADILEKDGIQRLSEIPPRQHQEVVAEYAARLEQRVATRERDAITAQLTQERNLAKFLTDVDAHFANDPDGKLAWLQSGTQDARAYLDGRAYLTSIANQTPEQRVNAISALQQRSARQFNRLDGFPDLQQQLAERQQQGRYPATDDGLNQLETDVDQLLVEAARGNGTKRTPAGTTPVRTARRPVVNGDSRTGSVRPSAGPDISKIKDPEELMRIGVEQQSRRLAIR